METLKDHFLEIVDYFRQRKKRFISLIFLLLLIIGTAVTLILLKNPQIFRSRAEVTSVVPTPMPGAPYERPNAPDLDVAYIERTPRYYRYCIQYLNDIPQLCSGTEDQKRWPDVGESITYTAHILNKGTISSAPFRYVWKVDGVEVKSGTHQGLTPQGKFFDVAHNLDQTIINIGDETESYTTTWTNEHHTIEFKIDPDNTFAEISKNNNSLAIGSHDLTLSFFNETGYYDSFNFTRNPWGSYSFEDYVQNHIKKMNDMFAQATYPVAPEGIKDRVRIDKFVIANQLDIRGCPDSSTNPILCSNNPLCFLNDGQWQNIDGKCNNANGNGSGDNTDLTWQRWADINMARNMGSSPGIDFGLIHEMAHQLGIIDLYQFLFANDPAANNRFNVTDINDDLIDVTKVRPLFPHQGIMGGGDITPHDSYNFESHTTGGLNSHAFSRRGYYGEYLFDTPENNTLKILDYFGNPLVGADISLYQKGFNDVYDNTPEITGITDSQGLLNLPNKTAPHFTSATGHTERDNPFGKINVVGSNGTMFVKVTKNGQQYFDWLTLLDLNLAYWAGNTTSATHTIKTDIDSRNINRENKALNKTASSNRPVVPGREPSKAVDGNRTTSDNYWTSAPIAVNDWWQVDLGNVMDVARVIIYLAVPSDISSWPNKFIIKLSTTGAFTGEETNVVTENNFSHLYNVAYSFNPTPARYIRIVSNANQHYASLQELEVFTYNSTSALSVPSNSFILSSDTTNINMGSSTAVKLLARSDTVAANLFNAKINFNKSLITVDRIDYRPTFIGNWVEQNYDNNAGTISLVGGITNPGFQTNSSNPPSQMAVIYFKGINSGTANISFANTSTIYSNIDNSNILMNTNTLDLLINPISTPIPTIGTGTTAALTPTVTPTRVLTPTPTPTITPASVVTPTVRLVGTGDGNNDGRIDLVDLSILLTYFNNIRGYRDGVDLNGDGIHNTMDFGLMRNLLILRGVIRP